MIKKILLFILFHSSLSFAQISLPATPFSFPKPKPGKVVLIKGSVFFVKKNDLKIHKIPTKTRKLKNVDGFVDYYTLFPGQKPKQKKVGMLEVYLIKKQGEIKDFGIRVYSQRLFGVTLEEKVISFKKLISGKELAFVLGGQTGDSLVFKGLSSEKFKLTINSYDGYKKYYHKKKGQAVYQDKATAYRTDELNITMKESSSAYQVLTKNKEINALDIIVTGDSILKFNTFENYNYKIHY